jgi:hypothetical protein
MYDKIFYHKLIEDIDDVRDYVESNMPTAAITRLNLIKKDIIKVSTLLEDQIQIRGKVIPLHISSFRRKIKR